MKKLKESVIKNKKLKKKLKERLQKENKQKKKDLLKEKTRLK